MKKLLTCLIILILLSTKVHAVQLSLDFAMSNNPRNVLKGVTLLSTEETKCTTTQFSYYTINCDEIIINQSEKYEILEERLIEDWYYYKTIVSAIYLNFTIYF